MLTDMTGLLASFDPATLPQQLINGLMTGAIYALVALGYTMVYGVLRLINFAHGEVFMLGMFAALFVSWWMGFGTNMAPNAMGTPWLLILMLLFSMLLCGGLGVAIERLAYRPMRNQPRIASLITAIGISLLIQHGGALFLPVSPPQSIKQNVNPFNAEITVWLKPRDSALMTAAANAKAQVDQAEKALQATMKQEGVTSPFDLSEEGKKTRELKFQAEKAEREARAKADQSGLNMVISQGRMIMFLTTIFLMFVLRFLVMNTPVGRQMRAVSHDFDSAALMGINVDRVIMFTFFVGSALAGAGGMMAATFQGEALTSFSGVEYGVKAFVAAVLGGIGNIPGAVLGGLILGMAETGVTAVGGSLYKNIIAFVILILVLLFRPGGILGSAKVEKV